MQRIEHITAEQIRRYAKRETSAAETLAVQLHVGECARCRERLAAVFDAAQVSTAIENDFNFADFDSNEEIEHLTYEQLETLIDNKADEVEREIAESHFVVCQECRRDFADLQRFRQIAETPAVAAPVALIAAAQPRKSWRRKLFAFDFSGWLIPAFGAAAILLVALGGWFLVRLDQTGGDEIARQNNNNFDAPPSPAPSVASSNVSIQNQQISNQNSPTNSDSNPANSNAQPTDQNPQPPRQNQPLLALSDNGKQIELDADGGLRGLENLPSETQNAVRQTLQTGRLRVSGAAREIAGGQNGVLMSGDAASGVAFALLSPVGKTVREQQPRLEWKPLPGATRYKVVVTDQNFRAIAESSELTATEWTLPKPLARGANYVWQVTAIDQSGAETVSPAAPAPTARFRVLDEQSAKRIDKLEQSGVKSNLARGVVFAEAGLIDEARREFRLLLARNPRSATAKRLLANLKSLK